MALILWLSAVRSCLEAHPVDVFILFISHTVFFTHKLASLFGLMVNQGLRVFITAFLRVVRKGRGHKAGKRL